MSLERKCPACGHVGATAVSVYSDILRCGFCGLTDSGRMFKDMSATPAPVAKSEEPPPQGEWTMDDMHIGRSANGKHSLTEKIIPRPPHLTNDEWYTYGKVVVAAIIAAGVK